MEIEKKYLIKDLPDLSAFPFCEIEQGYISTAPVIRIRRKDEKYILTVKGKGKMAREEFELDLDCEAYERLLKKVEGLIIKKRRYLIPLAPYTIELDVFENEMAPLIMAEVEFPSIEDANAFVPPAWFGEEVTEDRRYHNAYMSMHGYTY